MYQLTKKFPQKRAFITGAASGLGKALAELLATDGWKIGITDINPTALENAANELREKGATVFPYAFDVSDKLAFEKAAKDFLHHNNGIDLLINNAGVGDGGLFEEYSLDNWDWITGINQLGVIYGSFFFVPVMKKQRSGHIINVSSMAGVANMPNMSMYNVTKAAVISLAESIYVELAPFGVGVSLVLPTFFRSNIMQHNRGPEHATTIGKIKSQKISITPDIVAHKILKCAGKGQFYIYHPFQALWVSWLKRLSPTLFLDIKVNMFKKKKWVREAIKNKT
ncbi:MAG: SDR family NAD(P)-dependent oxidoreductase [Chitinophagales bacterium]|nr:SDR family NAD(P)-dependent oxidoreductase [Chitinophagales bacterium]